MGETLSSTLFKRNTVPLHTLYRPSGQLNFWFGLLFRFPPIPGASRLVEKLFREAAEEVMVGEIMEITEEVLVVVEDMMVVETVAAVVVVVETVAAVLVVVVGVEMVVEIAVLAEIVLMI